MPAGALFIPAPRRPTVLFQSDDWGRSGLAAKESIARLGAKGIPLGTSAWDLYGLESEDDVLSLGDTLASFRDRDGTSPSFTANFIMANADLRKMRRANYAVFEWVPLHQGFPEPWTDDLAGAYRANVARGVFYPGLHGFTHFNAPLLMAALQNSAARGDMARALAEEDIPYLASLTPEYNFALVDRRDGARFLPENDQLAWLERGKRLFETFFGRPPRTFCAPGYRSNTVTERLCAGLGMNVIQSKGLRAPRFENGVLLLSRNVTFEPLFSEEGCVDRALKEAETAIALGLPVIVCTHSVNYMTRHNGQAAAARRTLADFCGALLKRFPDLSFAHDEVLLESFSRAEDWRRPSAVEALRRAAYMARGNRL